MKHIVTLSDGEHHRFLVLIPWSEEAEENLRVRMGLAGTLERDQEGFNHVAFSFYDLDVHEVDPFEVLGSDLADALLDHGYLIHEGEINLGASTPERIDFGEMVVTRNYAIFRFGIKHVPEIYETRAVHLGDPR